MISSTPTRYFEDLVIGEMRVSPGRTVSQDELLAFARQYDPQYFHADAEAAKKSVFGELIASGIYTMALWRQLDHQIAADIRWICGIAWDDVRWPKAVRAQDTLRARATCIAKRDSSSDPRRGIAVYLYEMLNQHEEIVWRAESTNLVERRESSPR